MVEGGLTPGRVPLEPRVFDLVRDRRDEIGAGCLHGPQAALHLLDEGRALTEPRLRHLGRLLGERLRHPSAPDARARPLLETAVAQREIRVRLGLREFDERLGSSDLRVEGQDLLSGATGQVVERFDGRRRRAGFRYLGGAQREVGRQAENGGQPRPRGLHLLLQRDQLLLERGDLRMGLEDDALLGLADAVPGLRDLDHAAKNLDVLLDDPDGFLGVPVVVVGLPRRYERPADGRLEVLLRGLRLFLHDATLQRERAREREQRFDRLLLPRLAHPEVQVLREGHVLPQDRVEEGHLTELLHGGAEGVPRGLDGRAHLEGRSEHDRQRQVLLEPFVAHVPLDVEAEAFRIRGTSLRSLAEGPGQGIQLVPHLLDHLVLAGADGFGMGSDGDRRLSRDGPSGKGGLAASRVVPAQRAGAAGAREQEEREE